ncbi:hypothetical protein QQ045_030407 [Rhodiola kirilowii]
MNCCSGSSMMLRRFYCSGSVSTQSRKKPVVFLGSPQVSVTVLDALLNASVAPDSVFEVAAIVTQPSSARGRGRKVMPCPVAQHALDRGISSDLIYTPVKAGEETFLSKLKALQPEICITAAYGNILPTKFLKIPTKGTVNIHPSLLPLYRGAAPVQRAIKDGVKETGVSLAFTVRALDAGPVIGVRRMAIDDEVKAPELLAMLFAQGAELLIEELPSLFDGSAIVKAKPQDDSKATHAPKLSTDESWLCFDREATVLHNKVRAFAGWPGTRAKVQIGDDENGQKNTVELKIITTRVFSTVGELDIQTNTVVFHKGALIFPCARGTALQVLEVQLPGKKAVNAAAFWNGLRGQKLILC